MDYSVNDAYEYNKHGEDHHGFARKKSISIVAEKLLLDLRAAAPDMAIVGVVQACSACVDAAASWSEVYAHHNVPLVNFAALPRPETWWPKCKATKGHSCRMSAASASIAASSSARIERQPRHCCVVPLDDARRGLVCCVLS